MKAVKLFLAALFLMTTITVTAQEKSELNKKLGELKGKVEKVTVKVDGKDVVFEGKEAENLVKKLKSGAGVNYFYRTARGKSAAGNVKIITRSKDDDELIDVEELAASLDDEDALPANKMKMKVEKLDGNLKLTVVETGKDGKEIEKTYEGEEAEKYLKEHNEIKVFTSGNFDVKAPMKVKMLRGKPLRTVIIEKDTDDGDEKEIEATVVITEGSKVSKKDVVIEKKKKELKKENKED